MNKTFESETFITCIPYNILADIIIFAYGVFFTAGIKPILIPSILIGLSVIFIEEFVIELPLHKLLTRSISNEIAYFSVSKLNDIQKTNLIQRIMRFPLYKGIEVYLLFIGRTLVQSLIEYFVLGLDLKSSIGFFFICSFSSYIAFTLTIHNLQRVCSNTTRKISSTGIVNSIIDKHHFFGSSLFQMFTIYVLFTMINSGLFLMFALILDYEIKTIILISFSNVIILTIFAYFFFRRIKSYSMQMTGTLNSIIQNKIKKTELLPNDFSTEISYSMYLLNKTIIFFRNLLTNTVKLNNIINESTVNLSTIANQTQATATEQSAATQEISSTIKNIFDNSKIIQSKIDEVINVADKTKNNVDSNFYNLEQNFNMMNEITSANMSTIQGIQKLSKMIPKIQDIVNFINSVATQTKIIAFNAELEASKVGSNSTMFQDEAKKIKQLAADTLNLTKDIKDKIHGIENATTHLIETGQNCMNKIKEGAEISLDLKNKFNVIQKSAEETTINSKEIKDSIYNQINILDLSVKSLQHINESLIKFTDSTKTISSTVLKLKDESTHIKELTQEN